MKRFPTLAALAFALTSTLWLGCKSETTTDTPAPDMEAAEDAAEEEDMASLSADDRAIVMAQKICPVSGDDLGSMGPPIKVEVEGKAVFVCCDACIDPLKDEPAKYLAKLPDGGAAASDADEEAEVEGAAE